jgi:hypothetical protein
MLFELRRQICLVIYLILVGFLFQLDSASATVWTPLSTEQLVDRSDVIVSGAVLDSRHSDLVETPLPATIYTIEIEEIVRGSAFSETFELPVYGGCFGDFCEGIAGVPELEIGESYVLFLEGVGTDSQPFVGGPQGVFRIIQDGEPTVYISADGWPEGGAIHEALEDLILPTAVAPRLSRGRTSIPTMGTSRGRLLWATGTTRSTTRRHGTGIMTRLE